MELIGKIKCTPNSVSIGESVCVEVFAKDGSLLDLQPGVIVRINNSVGAKQWLQFRAPGNRKILVSAIRNDGFCEWDKVEVEVKESGRIFPILKMRPALDESMTAEFTLEQSVPKKRRKAIWLEKPKQNITPGSKFKQPLNSAEENLPFKWSVGSIKVFKSLAPRAIVDLKSILDPNKAWTTFDVSLEHEDLSGDSSPVVIKRTFSVLNLYYISKERGIIRPHVNAPLSVRIDTGIEMKEGIKPVVQLPGIRTSLTVKNLENEELRLKSSRLEVYFEEEESSSKLLEPRETDIVIGPKESKKIPLYLKLEDLPANAIAFGVHYKGLAMKSKKSVYFSSYFDIPERRKHGKVDPKVKEALKKVFDKEIFKEKGSVSLIELERLIKQGRLPSEIEVDKKQILLNKKPILSITPHTVLDNEFIIEGGTCDPYDLPDNVKDGFVCQATEESEYRWLPERFMNASKGDIILAPGRSGLITDVLKALIPPQYYTHCGIMTKDQTEVTHSTADEARLQNYPNPTGSVFTEGESTDGFSSDALKYMWPGVIKQDFGKNVNTIEEYPDPDNPEEKYTFSFIPQASIPEGCSEIVHPLVVKPSPTDETEELRDQLKEIANFAKECVGKSHYRFYCYTNPEIAFYDEFQGREEPGKWFSKTIPTVCSSFLWYCVLQKKPQEKVLEGVKLEKFDRAEEIQAEIVPNSRDGLYRYTAEERRFAGEALYSNIYNKVWDTLYEKYAGGVAEFIQAATDVAEDCANQVTNAFASDWTDLESTDSDAWKNTSDSLAVSPDNILSWDPPPNGLYGYHEPLVYRPSRYEKVKVYRWKHISGFGKVSGTVLKDGKAVGECKVLIIGSENSCISRPDGKFEMSNVAEGTCEIEANIVNPSDGSTWKTTKPVQVEVKRNKTTENVEINISEPDERYRSVELEVCIQTIDYDLCSTNEDEQKNFFEIAQVNPDHPIQNFNNLDVVADNEVLGRANFTVSRNGDNSVNVEVQAIVFDGPSDSDPASLSEPYTINVQPGAKVFGAGVHLKDEWGNHVIVYYNVKNKVDQAG